MPHLFTSFYVFTSFIQLVTLDYAYHIKISNWYVRLKTWEISLNISKHLEYWKINTNVGKGVGVDKYQLLRSPNYNNKHCIVNLYNLRSCWGGAQNKVYIGTQLYIFVVLKTIMKLSKKLQSLQSNTDIKLYHRTQELTWLAFSSFQTNINYE